MEIKLKSLRLENFKGIRKFTLEPGGKCLIRGANGSGKTTLMDAFLWLLFNKDSEGKADFAIKTLKNGQEIPNLEHSVEGAFDIDGQVLTLKKVLKEKYTKKRGSSQSDFTGHTTDYYIDGVPITQREYQDRVQSIINEETFKLLTSPMYFNSLHWEKRRALLLEVCGDISDSDVIASDKALASLPELLGNRLIENQKKVITSKRKEINDRLKEIPSRIDELDKSLTDVSEYDVESIHAEIKRLDDAIQAMKDDRQSSLLRKQKA
ncbi:MAG: AAA family ATPase, partial [Nanoarchaeota archaeon]|nr:AAA family ATPase [Nanoarchaeota archaeon]